MWILVTVVYSLIIVYEFIPLYKQKLWRDFWVNAVLCTFSFTIAFLLSLGVKLPSPAEPIRNIIVSMFGK